LDGSLNGRVRDGVVNGWSLDSLLDAQALIDDRCVGYNRNRPLTAHGDFTLSELVRMTRSRESEDPRWFVYSRNCCTGRIRRDVLDSEH